jgi:peptidoglycan/xylan/chitin deacetylase (PgdA/CDA1 family)
VLLGLAVVALAHTAPAPFILDVMAGETAVWRMPRGLPHTVYLTFDDGPNPATTPDLLDVLAREGVPATFFLIDEHITDETAPIVRRILSDGHAIGLHSRTRADVLLSPEELKQKLTAAAQRIEDVGGAPPCRAFRPHAGWRGGQMYTVLKEMDYRLVGWGWMLWDFNWLRARTADSTFARLAKRASAGDIIVMHDGDESAPRRPQPHTVEAAARLIPALRARGLSFGTVCRTGQA